MERHECFQNSFSLFVHAIFNHDYLECKLFRVKHNSALVTKFSIKIKTTIIIMKSFLENIDALL